MIRRPNASIAANPMLIGAVTVLVVIVAVFLSYNANNGLPFVPSYTVRAEVPDAAGLIRNNEVRMGGARIGVVSKIDAHVKRDGTPDAILTLKLDRHQLGLPRDTTIAIRPRSPLGLKYVQLTRGHAAQAIPDGGLIRLQRHATRPVEIDDFFGMWDTPTRRASGENLIEYGDAFMGRGHDLNEGLRNLKPLAIHGEAAGKVLTDPRTRFDALFPAFDQAATEVDPVAGTQADLFTSLHQTFKAWSSVAPDLQASISEGPQALDTATRELPAQARFTRDSTELFRRFRPAFAALAHASPGLEAAFRAGTPALRRSPQLNGRLTETLARLEQFAADARVIPGLERLAQTAALLQPVIAFATPAQTVCNYYARFFQNLGLALSESDSVGSFLRFSPLFVPQLPGSEAGPTAAPSNGPKGQDVSGIGDSFLHSNPYPNTAAPGQTKECEAGHEPYAQGRQVIGNVPGANGLYVDPTGHFQAARP